MENNKLVPMTEFIIKRYNSIMNTPYKDGALVATDAELFVRYANFLSQPLTLGQFIPVDEEGNVLSEPTMDDIRALGTYTESWDGIYWRKMNEYRAAKERVLFENVELDEFAYSCILSVSDYQVVRFNHKEQIWEYKTIEEMVNEIHNLTLTPNALKMIYGRGI